MQFKRAHKNFVLSPSAPTTIIPGDFVKVEADRGEDMGIVLSKTLARDFEEVMPTAGYRGRGFSSGQGERKFLYRLATVEERAALVKKVEDEEQALQVCQLDVPINCHHYLFHLNILIAFSSQVIREKVVEQQLPMNILDAEYQFDRHKLTFFFEANRRIDFRELVSELFSLYKTRIWMQQVDTSVLGMHDAGTELARATGFLPSHMDCSEFGSGLFSMQVATQQTWSYPDRDFDLKRNGNIGIATPLDRAEQSLPSLPAVLGPLPSSGGPFAFQPFH